MTSIEALVKTAESVVTILTGAGYLEGEALEQIDDVDEILFWHSLAKNSGGNKETYLVWNAMPSSPTSLWADNKTLKRSCHALIDIFSRYSMTDNQILNIMKKISNEALRNNWACEVYDMPSYDPDFKLTRLTLQISKVL